MSRSQTHALTLVAAPELRVATDDLARLQELALQQLSAIAEMETRAAAGAILAGLTLHRVKASLAHGEFGKWITQISTSGGNLPPGKNAFRNTALPTVKKSQANNYMRLALIFLEKSRVAKPDLLALPGDQTELSIEGASGPAKRFLQKLSSFVGESSLNELLVKYGIKGVSREGDDGEGANAKKGGEDFFAEVAIGIDRCFGPLTNPESLMRLPPKQLDLAYAGVTEKYELFKRLYREAKGKSQSNA